MVANSIIIIKVIRDRIRDHLYSTIDREQAGFRPESSCVDHINTLRIIEWHLVFVDFEKAFDSVDRERLWMALRRRLSVIMSTCNGAKCRVLHNATLSAAFVVGSGVRQGCILSVLFLVVIGDIIQATIAQQHSLYKYSGLTWKMDSFLQHLDYANDICLLSHSVLDAANMLYSLENEAASFRLKINPVKTKKKKIF